MNRFNPVIFLRKQPALALGFALTVLLVSTVHVSAQFPPNQNRVFDTHQLPSSTPPPVIPPVKLQGNQTLEEYRLNTFKDFLIKASQPQYRSIDGQMYDLQPLTDFLNWVAGLPNTPDTEAMLKTQTRPLPAWSLVYGRVAQVTDGNGILLWMYKQTDLTLDPKLVRVRNYPKEKSLVDGDIVVVFAKNEAPYSYIDSQRGKSTINSFNFGKPVTRRDVELFIQKRPLPTIILPPRTNNLSIKKTN
jgi:hypothetical protein